MDKYLPKEGAAGPPRLIFDPTINLGHVLTFAGFIGTGFGAYTTLDKRVAMQEQKALIAEQKASEQDQRNSEVLREIKADLKDVRRSVDDVNRNLSRSRP